MNLETVRKVSFYLSFGFKQILSMVVIVISDVES